MSTVHTPPSTQASLEFRLTHVAPVSSAGIVSLLFAAFSLLVIGVIKFFQFFDPTPPARDPQGVMLLIAAWVATIGVCFVVSLLLCWLFNLLARFTGGIRYRSSRVQ